MPAPLDRVKTSFAAIVEAILGARLDYHALYPCTVVAQDPIQGNLTLLPDDRRIRGFGLSDVKLRNGAPGYEYEVPSGTTVLLGFEAADPKHPYACLWGQGDDVDVSTFDGGTLDIARSTDPLTSSADLTTWALAVEAGITGVGGTVATPWKGPLPGLDLDLPGKLGTITSGNPKLKA